MRKFLYILAVCALFFFTSPIYAHPGDDLEDAKGCHHCWTNCIQWGLSYGEYHCHNNLELPVLDCVDLSYLCTQPSPSGMCWTEEQYQQYKISYARNGDYAGQASSQLQKCRDGIENYKTDLIKYDECTSYAENKYNECREKEKQLQNEYFIILKENLETQIKTSMTKACLSSLGLNSFYNTTTKKCECSSGNVLKENRCISFNENCQNQFGSNSFDKGGVCQCKDGYEFYASKTTGDKTCIKKLITIPITKIVEEKIEVKGDINKEDQVIKKPIKKTEEIKLVEKSTVNQIEIIEPETESVENVEQSTTTQIFEDDQIENNKQPFEEKSTMQKVKENTSSAIKHVVSFVENVFSKLKFW